MTRLLEGLNFTETDQGAENQQGVDAVELLEQKEKEIEEQKKEIEEQKKEIEEQKKRIAELEAKTGGAGSKEVCFRFSLFSVYWFDSKCITHC